MLPQYSGGLGVLAGDHLKAASDLGVPLVGIGLFYGAGYFRQSLAASGLQQEDYPALNPARAADGARDAGPTGADPASPSTCRASPCTRRCGGSRSGACSLLLLDANLPDNAPEARVVTDRLYGGNTEHRLRQEILLGVGGVRALAAVGLEPDVFHMNEGHAGFLVLERVRRLVAERGLDAVGRPRAGARRGRSSPRTRPCRRASTASRASSSSATSAPSGLDTGLDVERILRLGAEPAGDGEVFNMAVLGLRSAQRANGVSRLHGAVSRSMFRNLWPGFEIDEVPIGHITNGVHCPTWVNRDFAELYERTLGPDYAEPGRLVGAARRRRPTRTCGTCGARRGGGWSTRSASRLRDVLARPRRQPAPARLDRRRLRSRGADHRLRAPRPVLQAPDADPARPRAPRRAC